MRAAAIFSHHMVLQREKPIVVWGDGKEGEQVTVILAGQSAAGAVTNGRWQVTLPPMPAAEGLTLTVAGESETLTFTDVAIGEVWLCGGQSNMEYEAQNDQHAADLLARLTPDCGVRYYYTPKQRIIDENFDAVERNSGWSAASPEQSKAWSAVGAYFALEMQKQLGVTIGLVGANWGGTSATAWVSRETLDAHPELKPYTDEYDKAMEGKTREEHIREFDEYCAYQDAWYRNYGELMKERPELSWDEAQEIIGKSRYPGPMGPKNECRICGAYETVLQRVCPYTLRGFLYYQGESDDHRPQTYDILLEALIACWRKDWGDAELPFLLVQLPMFRYLNDIDHKHWCLIREAQDKVVRKLRNTGIAVLTDCGELDNIHPTDKAPVGYRLALQALSEVYGKLPQAQTCAPMYRMHMASGNTMTIWFANAEEGFALKGEPVGFELAGADGKYHPAKAVFCKDTVTLTAAEVAEPQFARYAWTNYMVATVFGRNGLPLASFRTDKNA